MLWIKGLYVSCSFYFLYIVHRINKTTLHMDVQSGILMVLSTFGLLLLLALLILMLIKPARRLKVSADFKLENENTGKSIVELKIENIGKKPMNIVYIYVRFYDQLIHKKVMLAPKVISCKIPYFIRKKEVLLCDLQIGDYVDSMKEQSFDIHSIKILVANSLSMEYASNALDVKG